MNLSRVKRVLHRRLAWLTASAEKSPASSAYRDERDALHTILRCQGMLDEERVALDVQAVHERVLPAVARTAARARQGDVLRHDVAELLVGIHRTARVI